MRLTINLATRTYINDRLVNLVLAVVGAVLTLAVVGTVWGIVGDTGTLRRLRGEIASLEGREHAGAKPVGRKELDAVLEQIRFANGLIERKSADWLQLLDRIETVVPDGISLTSVQPERAKQTLKLSGAARDFGRIRAMIDAMEASQDFTDVFLVSQSETRATDGRRTMTFVVTCKVVVQ